MEKLLISTPRLLIRHLMVSDLDSFHAYRSLEVVTKYQGFNVMDRDEASAFIADQTGKLFGKPGEWVQYGIELNATGKLIGDCAIKLQEADERIAEVGITISPDYQRQGFAKETLHGIVAWLFEVKQLHRIVETVDAENAASIQLLRSAGFREEGHFIENIFFKGKWGSEYQFALLYREWLQQKNH